MPRVPIHTAEGKTAPYFQAQVLALLLPAWLSANVAVKAAQDGLGIQAFASTRETWMELLSFGFSLIQVQPLQSFGE